jgi:hypothetical protein
MMNRVDNTTPHTSAPIDTSHDTASVEQTGAKHVSDDFESGLYDRWDLDQKYEDYLPSYDGPTVEAAERHEESFSVWEAQAPAEPAPSASHSDNFVANELAQGISEGRLSSEEVARCSTELDQALGQIIFDDATNSEIALALADRDELSRQLQKEFGQLPGLSQKQIDRAVERTITHAEDVVTSRAHSAVQRVVDKQLEDSENAARSLADQARPIAQQLIAQSGDEDQMRKALTNLGVAPSDAADIASDLAQIAADSEKRAAFLEGTEGDSEYFTLGDGWKDVEVDLKDAFDGIADDLANLRERAANDVHTNSRILTSGLWEAPREQVLADMMSDMSPTEAESFRQIIAEAKIEGESLDAREAGLKALLALVATAATGGLFITTGAGIAMAGASGAESVGSAYMEREAARTAVNQGFAAQRELDQAEAQLLASVVFASLSVAGGAAPVKNTPNFKPGSLVGRAVDTVDAQGAKVGFGLAGALGSGGLSATEQTTRLGVDKAFDYASND